jgi:SAM-dependent methyltransferase
VDVQDAEVHGPIAPQTDLQSPRSVECATICPAQARHVMRRIHVSTRSAETADLAKGSPDRFGYSWDQYADLLPEHEEQFLRWTALDKSFWKGVRFLDAGCGIGRNSYWPMTYGALGGVAVDVDDRTLRRARKNLAQFPNVEVRNQSIYDLREAETFDIAFSIGVVHHLSDPDAAIARLAHAVKPGGLVLVWLYGRENNGWIVYLFNPLRRALFSRLPLRLLHALSWQLSALLWCALRLGIQPGPYSRLLRGFSFEHLRGDYLRPHDSAHCALLQTC